MDNYTKERIASSNYLKSYYDKNPTLRDTRPLFKKSGSARICQVCGITAEISSVINGELEYAYCKNCYDRERIKKRMS